MLIELMKVHTPRKFDLTYCLLPLVFNISTRHMKLRLIFSFFIQNADRLVAYFMTGIPIQWLMGRYWNNKIFLRRQLGFGRSGNSVLSHSNTVCSQEK